MELSELIEWHLHNAVECNYEDEGEQKIFHLEAVALLARIKVDSEEENANE